MEPIITLPYSEYEVINQLQKYFKKDKGYAVYVPTSRQQKGIDFILYNIKNKKPLGFQVKGSRSYENKNCTEKGYRHTLWFNNFIDKHREGIADYYILHGIYPDYKPRKDTKQKTWKNIILVFTNKEMGKLLNNIRRTRAGKQDKFFYIQFNEPSIIFATRGFKKPINISNNLLSKSKLINRTVI